MLPLLNVLAIQPSHAVVGFNGFQKHAFFKATWGPLGSPKTQNPRAGTLNYNEKKMAADLSEHIPGIYRTRAFQIHQECDRLTTYDWANRLSKMFTCGA